MIPDTLNGQARAELVRTLHALDRDIEHARAHADALARRLEAIVRVHHHRRLPYVIDQRLHTTASLAALAVSARVARRWIEGEL